MSPVRLLSAVTLALVLGAAAMGVPASGQDDAARPSSEEARDLFLRNCAVCHGPRGRGTFRAPELTGSGAAATHFQMSTGRMPPDREGEGPVRTPSSEFSDPEILAVAEYVQSIAGGPRIPDVDTADADLTRGADLYLQGCAPCHGSSGSGSVLTGGDIAPALGDLTSVQIAEAMITGPGEMPDFSGVFGTDDRDAIVAYVEELQEPQNRGGLPLGHLGPGLEAAIALLIGLPLLVLFTRWVGRSAAERRLPSERAEREP